MSDAQPTGLIPDRLLSTIKQGDRVLFLGADLPLGYEGAPLSRPELAAALAERYGLPPNRPWPETATNYLGLFPHDRQGLTSFVLEQCSRPQVQPGPLHETIARCNFRAIVTAWYDELLEESLRQAGYSVHRIVRDPELSYARESEQEVIVVKLYGCVSDSDSLVLDTWDHDELMERLHRKLELVTAFCTLRPPLFVNFDLLDPTPRRLYLRASRNMARHMRRAFAIWPHGLEEVRAVWQGKNVEFLQAGATAFLSALAAQLPAVGPAAPGAIHVNRPPFKFLDYYEVDDADIFCGRDTETQIVTRLALSHRLLTLFGPSGAGKTSLLLGGVVPRLDAEGYSHIYVRALDDPLPALRRAIAARAGRDATAQPASLRDFLAATLAEGDRLVVLLDQFEELFIRVGSGKREAFFQELAEAMEEPEREVRFVFSLREDYLARLDEARRHIPDVLSNSFRLAALDRSSARVAITEPAARAGVVVEPALVDELVGGEGREGGGGALVESDEHVTRVPPAVLQIVLDRLYREALPERYDPEAPPPRGLTLDLASYQDIAYTQQRPGEEPRQLSGAEAILSGYVHEGVGRLAEPGLAREILKVLVTSQSTKAALTQGEIEKLLDDAGAIQSEDEADRRLVRETRLGLERVRLLRGFERDRTAYYELAHDYLAAEIASWIDEAEMQTKLARELLRRAMDNWRHLDLLIPADALQVIQGCCEELKRLEAAELELLLRSALAVGQEVVYWSERAGAGGVAVGEIAREELRSENFRTRAGAVGALAQLGEGFAEDIVGMLGDLYPQVRVAAIQALERLRPEGKWREHLVYECYVPAGPFIMGDDAGRYDDEKPAHEVVLEAYYIGKYPVTNAEYVRYREDVGRPFEIPDGKEQHPVVTISWYEARDYALWAGMRLPTEAEWEKAASWDESGTRGRILGLGKKEGRKRKYPWGDAFDKEKCNTSEAGIGGTTPVGRYSPAGDSPYGCADMAGNVWEWCSSLYKPYPYRADDGREEAAASGTRVLRGGSFYSRQDAARCAFRDHGAPDRLIDLYRGVRCCFVPRFSAPDGA